MGKKWWVYFFAILTVFLYPKAHIHAQTPPFLKAGYGIELFSTLPSVTEVLAKTDTAARAAQFMLDGEPAKVVLVLNNTGFIGEMAQQVKTVFGDTALITGIYTGTVGQNPAQPNYPPFSISAFPEPGKLSLTITAIGGPAITRVQAANDDGKYGWGGDEAAITEGGKIIASKLTLDQNKKNLLIILGPGHTPNNEYLLNGMKQVWGDPLPANLKVVGLGSADGKAISVIDTVGKWGSAIGVLISGDFQMSLRGVGEGFGGDPRVVSKDLLSQVKTELGGRTPDILFYVPGHPQTEQGYTSIPAQEMFDGMRQAVIDVFGSDIALFGHHATSETGHKTTDGSTIASRQHFFIAGVAGKNAAPTSTPQPTPPPGDVDGNGTVNIADFKIIVTNYGKMTSVKTDGDLTQDGKVNLSDFGVWAASLIF